MLIDKIKILHAGSDAKSNIDYYGMVCFRNGKALASNGTTTIIVETGLDPLLHVCVNAEKLYRIVKAFKDDPDQIRLENNTLRLAWFEHGWFDLPIADGDTFPQMGNYEHASSEYHSGNGVVSAIQRVLFCAEEDIAHNPICGVNLSPEGVMATNRKEVVRVILEEPFKSTFRIAYPAAKLLSKQKEDPESIFTLGNTLGFRFKDFTLMTRGLQGDFPVAMLMKAVSQNDEDAVFPFPERMESVMRVFNSVASAKEFYVTLYSTGSHIKRASLDGDIPAEIVFDDDQVITMCNSASLRGDRLMIAAKNLAPTGVIFQPNFVQFVSDDCVYSLGRVS